MVARKSSDQSSVLGIDGHSIDLSIDIGGGNEGRQHDTSTRHSSGNSNVVQNILYPRACSTWVDGIVGVIRFAVDHNEIEFRTRVSKYSIDT